MTAAGQPVVRIRGLKRAFGSHRVLDGVDLDVAEGSVTVLLGPSGSGKSTLLRCVNHLERPDAGFVEVAGEIVGYRHREGRLHELPAREVTRQRSRVGMVFQQFNLFPHLTVGGNVMLSQTVVKKTPKAEAEATARKMLERVGLGHRFDAYPDELSGGQQQRVAIARALAMQPTALLCDEITSALDPELVAEVLAVVRELAAGALRRPGGIDGEAAVFAPVVHQRDDEPQTGPPDALETAEPEQHAQLILFDDPNREGCCAQHNNGNSDDGDQNVHDALPVVGKAGQ